MSAIDFMSNILYPETEIKTEIEIKMIMKTETKTEMFSKIENNRNIKELITHKTVIETELIFKTEIPLVTGRICLTVQPCVRPSFCMHVLDPGNEEGFMMRLYAPAAQER